MKVIDAWHAVVSARDASGLDALLAPDVIFHSPVVHTSQRGREITKVYLTAALAVFGNGSFRYVREVVGEHDAVLEFVTEIEGTQVNGVDMITWDKNSQISNFKIMVRPLRAIQLIHQLMAAQLPAR